MTAPVGDGDVHGAPGPGPAAGGGDGNVSANRQGGRKPGSSVQSLGWNDMDALAEAADPAPRALTREEAQALRALHPPISPWRVVGVQAGVGVVAALLVALVTGRQDWAWSLLYGAATVALPGALLARGMGSRLSDMSPGANAVSFMLWEVVKVAVSVAMLVLAPKLVQPLNWLALLAGLVLCLKVYLVALLWRGSNKN